MITGKKAKNLTEFETLLRINNKLIAKTDAIKENRFSPKGSVEIKSKKRPAEKAKNRLFLKSLKTRSQKAKIKTTFNIQPEIISGRKESQPKIGK